MIKWHKVKDGLPPHNTPVLVSMSYKGLYLPCNTCFVTAFIKYWFDGDEVMWKGAEDEDDIYWINEDDQWAYINLPEDEVAK